MSPFLIGTRGSRLALRQANYVADLLRPWASPRGVELVEIETAGDQSRSLRLTEIGGEGLFTKEIQRALIAGQIDVAVHSLKDLPTTPAEGIVLAAVPGRGPTADVLVSKRFPTVESLPFEAIVATGSPRRRAQLLHRRPDLQVVSIRGNVETRLEKLDSENLDAVILAHAGLERLGLAEFISQILDQDWMVPAPGQGALGLECRAGDSDAISLAWRINDAPTLQAVTAERSLLLHLGGGCQVPIGALASAEGDLLHLRAAVLDASGKRRITGEMTDKVESADEVGQKLGQELLNQGAAELLNVR